MSEHRINSTDGLYVLRIDTSYDGVTPVYDTVVCLTTFNINDTVDVVDTSSMCGISTAPGVPKTEISASGYMLQDPDAGKTSATNLRPLIRAKTKIAFIIEPLANPQEGDEVQEGIGFLSALSSTYAYDSDASFDLSISPLSTVSSEIVGS